MARPRIPPADLTSSHTTAADGNVFVDLGFSPEEAKALLADADARIATAMTIVRINLPEGLTNETALERLASAGCTEATVGVGKAGVLVLDYGDAPWDAEAVGRAVVALVGLGEAEAKAFSAHRPGEPEYWLAYLYTPEGRKVVGTPELRHLALADQVSDLVGQLQAFIKQQAGLEAMMKATPQVLYDEELKGVPTRKPGGTG